MRQQKLADLIKSSSGMIASIIGTITTIIGFSILLRENFQLFALVIILIIMALLQLTLVYIVSAKTQSNLIGAKERYRFPRARPWAIGGFFTILVFGIFSLFTDSVQNFTTIAIHGTPISSSTPSFTPTPTLPTSKAEIRNVLIGVGEDDYKIEVTTLNPYVRDLLITHIRIVLDAKTNFMCQINEVADFKISDQIKIVNANNDSIDFASELNQETGGDTEYAFPAQGSIHASCGNYRLELGFDSSFIMPRDSYSVFIVRIPKRFDIPEDQVGLSFSSRFLLGENIFFPPYPSAQENMIDNYEVLIEVTLDSQELMSITLRK